MSEIPPGLTLCADDYALTEGVSRGIEALAVAGRLSATSALVATRHWAEHGQRVAGLRRVIAVGLHFNLTLGAPLGAMPGLAPGGRLPAIAALVQQALLGRVSGDEVREEMLRQIARFREVAECDPDFVDGHQHVHALPGVRAGVIAALGEAFPPGRPRPWVRDPADTLARILARGAATAKALQIAALSRGFGAAVRAAGFATNDSFSGVSPFDRGTPFAQELARFLSHPGARHLVMCHPGYVDDELASLDPVVERREDELASLMAYPGLDAMLARASLRGGAAA